MFSPPLKVSQNQLTVLGTAEIIHFGQRTFSRGTPVSFVLWQITQSQMTTFSRLMDVAHAFQQIGQITNVITYTICPSLSFIVLFYRKCLHSPLTPSQHTTPANLLVTNRKQIDTLIRRLFRRTWGNCGFPWFSWYLTICRTLPSTPSSGPLITLVFLEQPPPDNHV